MPHTLFLPLILFCLIFSSVQSQAKSQEIRLGILNTDTYSATRAPQGMAIATYNSKTSLFVSVPNKKTSPHSQDDTCRIFEFYEESPGHFSQVPQTASKPLPIGHGQGFGVLYKDKKLYFVCTGKKTGITLVRWRGAKTSAEDCTHIPLFPEDSPYTMVTPTVSTDGKYLVTLCAGLHQHICFVWPIKRLERPFPPITLFAVKNDVSQGNSWQGLAADAHSIYLIHGGVYAAKRHTIARYSYAGKRIAEILLADEKQFYKQEDGIVRLAHAIPWNIELEGVALYNNHIYYIGVCTLIPYGDIVEYRGRAYACIQDTDGKQNPFSHKHFIQTTREAEMPYTYGTIYTKGRGKKEKYKFLYRINKDIL